MRARGREVCQPAFPGTQFIVKAQTPEGHLKDTSPGALLHADVGDLTLMVKRQNVIWKTVE